MTHADALPVGTRARILREAAALFHRRGFEAASMKELAAAVGIQKSTLYHHFRSKQELLLEILEHTVEMAIGGLQAIAGLDRPAAGRLRLAVRHHVINLVEDLDNVACFVEEEKALAPAYRALYIARRDAYEQGFRRIIEDGIATGEFRAIDVRLAGFAILGMCNWMVRWFRPSGPYTPEDIAAQLGDLAVASLAPPAPTSARTPVAERSSRARRVASQARRAPEGGKDGSSSRKAALHPRRARR